MGTARACLLGMLTMSLVVTGCWPDFDVPVPEPRDGGGLVRGDGGYSPECLGEPDVIDGDSIAAADEMLAGFADGHVVVPLSRLGCVRFERVVEGGRLMSASISKVVNVAIDETTYAPYDVVATLARWERDSSGVLRGSIDADDEADYEPDDFFEVQEIVDESAGRIERSWYDAASREVAQRLIISREADATYRQRREDRVEGALVTTSDGPIVAATQSEIIRDGSGCAVSDCDAVSTQRLDRLSREALREGFACLGQRGQDPGNARAQGLEQLFVRWRSAHRWRCVSGCSFVGQFNISALAEGRPLEMGIDLARTDPEVMSTISHEWSHGYLGGHAEDMLELIDRATRDPAAARIRDAADPVYACQAYCFGGARNRCTCARCYGVRACHPLCAGEPSCVTRDELSMTVLTNEAVGASCEPRFFSDRTWHFDMQECRDSGCSTCRSHSVSCDPTCQ